MTADLNRRSYRVEFLSVRGHRLAGIVDEASESGFANRPDGPPVLIFSHCFTCNKDLKAIVRISRKLADLGVTVLRFDMTGLGNSQGDFSQTNFSTNCEDIATAIQFANEQIGPVRSLMGHSFGGAASIAVAAELSEHLSSGSPNPIDSLRSLILLAAPSDTLHLGKLLLGMNPAIESKGLGEVSIGGRDWTIRRQMLQDFDTHDLTSLIPKVALPTLIFHSPSDETVRFDHAIRIMGLMSGNASLVTMNGSDHLLTRQASDWDWVAHTTAAFVSRQCDAS